MRPLGAAQAPGGCLSGPRSHMEPGRGLTGEIPGPHACLGPVDGIAQPAGIVWTWVMTLRSRAYLWFMMARHLHLASSWMS